MKINTRYYISKFDDVNKSALIINAIYVKFESDWGGIYYFSFPEKIYEIGRRKEIKKNFSFFKATQSHLINKTLEKAMRALFIDMFGGNS